VQNVGQKGSGSIYRRGAVKCDVCNVDSEKTEVRHFSELYTMGSEGTCLCNRCCIIVCNFIKGMQNMAQGIRKEAYLQLRK
jgi:hypothetical protein